jgi:RNA polymerase sigma factor (sigma-70 family)
MPDAIPGRSELEALLTNNLEWLRGAATVVCRRHRLDADETDEFVSLVVVKVMEDDYAILRKFRGESQVTTYLTVVVASLFRDYRAREWGRWRPSAAARRLGPLAIRLETLVYRDGCRVDQAGEILRSSGYPQVTDRELVRLLSELPHRSSGRSKLTEETLKEMPAASTADGQVLEEEAAGERTAAEAALHRALATLPHDDAVIVRMRIWEGSSLADIARSLHLPQKPLYRRMEKILLRLRTFLKAEGIDQEYVLGLHPGGEPD